jgi:hypothetical protein
MSMTVLLRMMLAAPSPAPSMCRKGTNTRGFSLSSYIQSAVVLVWMNMIYFLFRRRSSSPFWSGLVWFWSGMASRYIRHLRWASASALDDA